MKQVSNDKMDGLTEYKMISVAVFHPIKHSQLRKFEHFF